MPSVVGSHEVLLEQATAQLGLRRATVAGGAVLGVGIWLLGRWWTRLHVAELRKGA